MATDPPPPLTFQVSTSGELTTIVLGGELDVTAAPLLRERLAQILAGQPRLLIFDMADVSFLDCAAARLIVRAGWSLPDGPSPKPVLRHASPQVRRLLALTGLIADCELETGPD